MKWSNVVARFVIVLMLIPIGPSTSFLAAQEGTDTSPPPPSSIVEIENHGERFFDDTDSAAAAFNRIGERGEIWQAAREAKRKTDANPDDEEAQAAYRAAKARLLHEKFAQFREALGFQGNVIAAHRAFDHRLNVEMTAIERDVAREQETLQQYDDQLEEFYDELEDLKQRLPDGVRDLESDELALMNDIKREIDHLKTQKQLAEDRELLASNSLIAVQQSKIDARDRYEELQEEFQQAAGDLRLLQAIAYNDLQFENYQERRKLLQRFQDREPLRTRGNRKTLDELLERNRERRERLKNSPRLIDRRRDRNSEAAEELLNSVPASEPASIKVNESANTTSDAFTN